MLWPFNHFRRPRSSPAGSIDAIYGMIVTQAREPSFYRDLGVPDTVEGRFDLLLLHLWVVLRRLRRTDGAMEPGSGPIREQIQALAQGLFDRFCEDMDDNLREMGIGDLAVPLRMQAFGEAFYGRSKAYDLALGRQDSGQDSGQSSEHGSEPAIDALAQAIDKNILCSGGPGHARALAAYARAVATTLTACDDTAILRGTWSFPLPAPRGNAA